MDQFPNDEEIDAYFEQLKTQPAVITTQEMEEIERCAQDNALSGIPRRVLLGGATLTGAEIMERAATDRDFAVAGAIIVQGSEGWIERQKAMIELAEAVVLRFHVALCQREDMEQVMTEGNQMLEEQNT